MATMLRTGFRVDCSEAPFHPLQRNPWCTASLHNSSLCFFYMMMDMVVNGCWKLCQESMVYYICMILPTPELL
jgi:hypothetical protein